MTRTLASGAASAIALARSRTMEALVLNRSGCRLAFGELRYSIRTRTVSGHSRLPWHTSWDQDDFGAGEGILEARTFWCIALDIALGIDVTDVGSDTCQMVSDGPDQCLKHCTDLELL